jgi:Tfp pilus assembly protein PilN
MASPNELSFLPDDYMERKAQRRTNVICALLFLVVMVAIGSAFTFTERLGRDIEQQHDSIEKQYTEAAKRIAMKQELEAKQVTMEKQAELSAALLEKVPRSYMLAKITNALPAGVSLLDLIMESKVRAVAAPVKDSKATFEEKRKAGTADKNKDAKPVQQAKLYDVALKITGIAGTDVQVAQLITRLNQLRIFKEVNLLISDEYASAGTQLRKFQLEVLLDPQAEAIVEADKTQTAALEVKEK